MNEDTYTGDPSYWPPNYAPIPYPLPGTRCQACGLEIPDGSIVAGIRLLDGRTHETTLTYYHMACEPTKDELLGRPPEPPLVKTPPHQNPHTLSRQALFVGLLVFASLVYLILRLFI